jgi:general secretion pathway protein M
VSLSPLASRLIAWGLLTNLCWALIAFVALPLRNQIRADRETIAESRELLARYRRLERELPLVQAQLDQVTREADADRYFFAANSPALASAEMQNVLHVFVDNSGATLRGSRSLQPTTEAGFDRIGFDLDVIASAQQLSALLRAIAEAEPSVLVERMTAQVAESGAGSAAADGQPSISVALRLVSYVKHDPVAGKS